MEGFINTITVGETSKVSDAWITSIHFPILCYFTIFASRCLIGRENCGNLSAPDIVILCHALFCDDTFSMGAIVAKWLNLNRTKGPVFGGIFASRLAAHFNIPIRHYEKEEKLLPPVYLDYKSMVAHDFIVKNRERALKYKLLFDKNHPETISLPAPSLLDLSAGPYLVPLAAIHAYWNPTLATEPEPEPQFDPPRQSNAIANQWQSEASSQYDPNYNYGYPPGQP